MSIFRQKKITQRRVYLRIALLMLAISIAAFIILSALNSFMSQSLYEKECGDRHSYDFLNVENDLNSAVLGVDLLATVLSSSESLVDCINGIDCFQLQNIIDGFSSDIRFAVFALNGKKLAASAESSDVRNVSPEIEEALKSGKLAGYYQHNRQVFYEVFVPVFSENTKNPIAVLHLFSLIGGKFVNESNARVDDYASCIVYSVDKDNKVFPDVGDNYLWVDDMLRILMSSREVQYRLEEVRDKRVHTSYIPLFAADERLVGIVRGFSPIHGFPFLFFEYISYSALAFIVIIICIIIFSIIFTPVVVADFNSAFSRIKGIVGGEYDCQNGNFKSSDVDALVARICNIKDELLLSKDQHAVAEQRFSLLAENINFRVCYVLADGSLGYYNNAFNERFIDGALNNTKNDSIDFFIKNASSVLASRRSKEMVCEFSNSEGGIDTYEVAFIPELSSKSLELESVLIITREMTDKRIGNSSLDIIPEPTRVVGQLASGVEHDFNDQLNGLLGFCRKLQMTNLDVTQKEYLDFVLQCASRCTDLVKGVFSLARVEGTVGIIDLKDIVKRVCTVLRRTIDRRIVINTLITGDSFYVSGDTAQIESVLQNLCLNARDAMPDGGALDIKLDIIKMSDADCEELPYALKPGVYVRLIVVDAGQGMDKKTQLKIFDPSFTTKKDIPGAGMGLYVALNTIKSHGGAMEVKSTLGKGSEFTVLLPFMEKVANHSEESSPIKSSETTGDTPSVSGLTILVTEDETVNMMLIKSMLEESGHTVLSATNGSEAVEIFREKHEDIDLIMMDIVMPVMDGKTAFKKIRQLDDKAKIVIISGYDLDSGIQDLLNSGAVGFVAKPFEPKAINELLARIT